MFSAFRAAAAAGRREGERTPDAGKELRRRPVLIGGRKDGDSDLLGRF